MDARWLRQQTSFARLQSRAWPGAGRLRSGTCDGTREHRSVRMATTAWRRLSCLDIAAMVRMRSSSILIKGSKAKGTRMSPFCFGAFNQHCAAHLSPDHGCARTRSGRVEAAESSQARSGQVEERSVRWYTSTGNPDRRRSMAKTILPRQADMVRMRSSSILIKGSTKGLSGL
jgi:hypothetical protein